MNSQEQQDKNLRPILKYTYLVYDFNNNNRVTLWHSKKDPTHSNPEFVKAPDVVVVEKILAIPRAGYLSYRSGTTSYYLYDTDKDKWSVVTSGGNKFPVVCFKHRGKSGNEDWSLYETTNLELAPHIVTLAGDAQPAEPVPSDTVNYEPLPCLFFQNEDAEKIICRYYPTAGGWFKICR